MTKPQQNEIEDFLAEARSYLDAHATRRQETSFAWGEGSDAIPLLEVTDTDEDSHSLEESRAWRRKVFDDGFSWRGGPKELGGGGGSPVLNDLFRELEGHYDVPDASFFGVAVNMLAPAIRAHGSDDLKGRYLAAIQRGDIIGCQLFSEPGAGSDLASVRTRAVRDGDHWIVTGQKVWSSLAHLAQAGELLVRTDTSVPKHQGLTMFIVDMDTPGIDVRPLRQITGGSSFNEVFLDEVRIPDANRVGEVGEGWGVARTTLASERTAFGAGETTPASIGLSRLTSLVAHLGLAGDPIVRQRLAEVFTYDEVIRLMGIRAAETDGRGPEGSIAKILFSDQARRMADVAGELLGDSIAADTGTWGEYTWADFMLSGPGLRLGGGTDQIQRNILAERVLQLPREPQPANTKESS